MKIPSKMNKIRVILLLAALTAMAPFSALAQNSADPYPDYQEDVFMDMDFEPNLLSPAVPKDALKSIVAYQKKITDKLKKAYTIDMFRNNDVFAVVIPTDELFMPNDTLLSQYAARQLTPLLELMQDPYMYKVMIAVHTDDTGSELYRQQLSLERLNSVYDWLMDAIDDGKLPEEIVIIPYSMASSEPLVSNDTREHRRENRRLEVYFIPGPRMIEKASKNQLK